MTMIFTLVTFQLLSVLDYISQLFDNIHLRKNISVRIIYELWLDFWIFSLKMGNSRSSLQLQQENIEQISEETGCESNILFITSFHYQKLYPQRKRPWKLSIPISNLIAVLFMNSINLTYWTIPENWP